MYTIDYLTTDYLTIHDMVCDKPWLSRTIPPRQRSDNWQRRSREYHRIGVSIPH